MANELNQIKGTQLTLGSSGGGNTASVSDGGYAECVDDTRTASDSSGYVMGLFEFATNDSTAFSAAPTAGAVINVFEQKIVGGSNDAPDVDASYQNDYIGSFPVDLSTGVQYFEREMPINLNGGKYWINWVDGGAGTASLSSNWSLKLTPLTYGTSA